MPVWPDPPALIRPTLAVASEWSSKACDELHAACLSFGCIGDVGDWCTVLSADDDDGLPPPPVPHAYNTMTHDGIHCNHYTTWNMSVWDVMLQGIGNKVLAP